MQLGKAVAAGVAPDQIAEKVDAGRPEVMVEAADTAVPETVGSATAR